ncbi:FAD-dependent monooxygenase [Cellulomonas sp. ICMP 17802]|uniref:FAD-dependent monooxygenase n=1 Tax=Cellulomonas sp. ICMP 17802 TaxID=3239199 RepID=UPI00351B9307
MGDENGRRASVDVLVVGAGPTGLALAAELARRDVRVRIVDRQLDRVRESRALAIQPRTLEVLAPLGVTAELLRRGNRAVAVQVHFPRRVVRMPLFDLGTRDTRYPFLLFLSQAETEQVLGQDLDARGVRLERGVELVGFVDGTDAATCTLRDAGGREETVEAQFVVGCDGSHSTVRRLAGIPFTGSAYPQTFVLADLEADGIEPGAAHAFLGRSGMLFFFPLGSPSTWRMLAMRPLGEPVGPDEAVRLPEVQALADRYTGGGVRVRDPVWMTRFRLHNRGAAHYRAGRAFVAGDAAHVHSPAGAQGMNTGIQDAVNLAWKLALVTAGGGRRALLDTYEAERAPVGRTVLRFTDRAFTVATSTNASVVLARTRLAPAVLPTLARSRAGRACAFRTLSELGIRYRHSPLSVDGPGSFGRAVRAGDRLPDAPVVVDGRLTTLHEATAGRAFHLIMLGPVDHWALDAAPALAGLEVEVTVLRLSRLAGPRVLHDGSGRVHRLLGVDGSRPGHLLVRPDGYVAYRGGRDLSGLRAYLDAWFTRRVRG